MQELDWEKPYYPLYGSTITIPEGTIIWRGYDISYPLGDRPTFYRSKMTAAGYANLDNRRLGSFKTTYPLRVVDIRYLKILLKDLFKANKKASKDDIQMIKAATISYGLCSLRHQLRLVDDIYGKSKYSFDGFSNLERYYTSTLINGNESFIEEDGVRIAETNIDAYTMGFIKTIFEDIFDGIISPRLASPFHVEKNNTISPELLIFNPQRSLIQVDKLPAKLLSIPINGIILRNNYIYTTKHISAPLSFYMRGGMRDTDNLYNKGVEIGNKWKKKNGVIAIEPPTPYVKLDLFPSAPGAPTTPTM
jgi:hypothetical protein